MPISQKLVPTCRGVVWGTWEYGFPAGQSALARVRQETGQTPAVALFYQGWAGQYAQFDVSAARVLWSQRIVPMVMWEPWLPAPPWTIEADFSLARIAAGQYDDYITAYARSVREYGGPLLLAPLHEGNGSWYPWGIGASGNTPQEFIAGWRRIWQVFQKVGATNATFAWVMNNVPVNFSLIWPGPQYVDWVGLTGYNWGTNNGPRVWQTPNQVYDKPLAALEAYGKPILLGEVGSTDVGGNKAVWVDQFFQWLVRHPEVKVFNWFDDSGWRVDSSPQVESAFRRGLAQPNVVYPWSSTCQTFPGQQGVLSL